MLYNYIDMDNLKGVKTIHMLRKEYESAVITMQKKGRHVATANCHDETRNLRVSLASVIATMAFVANTMCVCYKSTIDILDNNAEAIKMVRQEEIKETSKANIQSEDRYNQIVEQEIARQMEREKASEETKKLIGESQAETSSPVVEEEFSEENSLSTTISKIASEDLQLLAKITYAEAGNQTLEQQLAVAATILNRVESESFPNTIQEVISQKGQFSSVKGGTVMAFGEPVAFAEVPESCVQAAERALAGEDPTEELLRQEAISKGLNPDEYASGGALFFYNPDYCGSSEIEMRNSIQVKVEFGDHIFYKVW